MIPPKFPVEKCIQIRILWLAVITFLVSPPSFRNDNANPAKTSTPRNKNYRIQPPGYRRNRSSANGSGSRRQSNQTVFKPFHFLSSFLYANQLQCIQLPRLLRLVSFKTEMWRTSGWPMILPPPTQTMNLKFNLWLPRYNTIRLLHFFSLSLFSSFWLLA